ncbi:MAG: hypothetical protein KatS3mg109_1600 [Pirellulaceae bacterium]|nr:MAG: hypothetical protein KatS3mg109_1568 [Pirellulaceae bacterium]GIW91168.1 MAG: hypothetical protein KatS3mg109_1600 [Pirellulaceae bacterium]GIW95952.1 MAG: hypothetical protein KatS3mg110_3993 [Pirellulaceae bacterium]
MMIKGESLYRKIPAQELFQFGVALSVVRIGHDAQR